jgi:glyoxylase-like metal-dependent hydrolase (beta-lactamase superfamily II)
MDSISFPPDLVTPLDPIAPGVQGLRIIFVNVFGISHRDGSWTLIDAGLPSSAPFIRRWAEQAFHLAPKAIVLTHGHFDHMGAASSLADYWDIPIYAHPLEIPYLTGECPEPNLAADGGIMPMLSPLYSGAPADLGRRLQPLTSLLGWEILHTPGHTPGHLSFYRTGEGTLLAGDAFCTTRPGAFFQPAADEAPALHAPPGFCTHNRVQAKRSVEKLARLGATTLVPGHGQPISGVDVAGALGKLAAEFDDAPVLENDGLPTRNAGLRFALQRS